MALGCKNLQDSHHCSRCVQIRKSDNRWTQRQGSREIKVGDVIEVKKPPVTYSFKVLALAENRMGAKLVPGFLENVTPKEQLEVLELNRMNGFINRAKGLGRPTKKDRRDIVDFTTPEYIDEFDFSLEDLDEFDEEDWKEIMGGSDEK